MVGADGSSLEMATCVFSVLEGLLGFEDDDEGGEAGFEGCAF